MTKINIKARLKRQSRIIKENKAFGIKRSSFHTSSIITIIFFFLVILFPVYPSIAGYIHGDDFYRGDIDKNSIIESFDIRDEKDLDLFTSGEETDDDILDITPLEEQRDTRGDNEIIEYVVEEGDSIGSLANKFKISPKSIISLNHLEKTKYLKPGMKLKILPTSGILYKIKPGDTLSVIAKKFNVDEKKIIEQNFSTGEVLLKAGEEIIIPGAKYIPPKPKIIEKKPEEKLISKNKAKKEKYKKARLEGPKLRGSTYKKKKIPKKTIKKTYKKKIWSTKGYYKLRRHRAYSGAPGNCTWYVASYKNVRWRGNANRWLYNASRAKAKVHWGRITPRPGFIVVFNGRGYNPRYGHVAIVMSVNAKKGTMVVSEMNYAGLRRVTYRTVKLNHRAIRGYIDVGPY